MASYALLPPELRQKILIQVLLNQHRSATARAASKYLDSPLRPTQSLTPGPPPCLVGQRSVSHAASSTTQQLSDAKPWPSITACLTALALVSRDFAADLAPAIHLLLGLQEHEMAGLRGRIKNDVKEEALSRGLIAITLTVTVQAKMASVEDMVRREKHLLEWIEQGMLVRAKR